MSTNKFANALKGTPKAEEVAPEPEARPAKRAAKAQPKASPARRGKHIGGYFDPAVGRQLRVIAGEEEQTVQSLLEEALDMLFQARGRPMIAKRSSDEAAA
jgi:hypothetical protein